MKLKNILSKKTIDLIVMTEDEIKEQLKKDFPNGEVKQYTNGCFGLNEEVTKKDTSRKWVVPKDYVMAMFMNQLKEKIKEKDTEYYNQLYCEIKGKKGNANVNINKLYQMDLNLGQLFLLVGAYQVFTNPNFRINVKEVNENK